MLKLLYLISFFDIVAFALLLPIGPIHLLQIGGARFHIGLLASIHACLQLFIGPLIGSWSDSKGRKPLLIQLGILTLISNALLLIPASLTFYFISRILFGVSAHAQILVKALISDNVPKNEQAGVYAKYGALLGLSFVVGPLIGGTVHTAPNGFFYIATLLTSLSALNLLLSFALPDEKPKASNQDSNKRSKSKNKKKGNQETNKKEPNNRERLEIFKALTNLKNIDWGKYWDIFTLKFLSETSASAFFSSFGMILMIEFRSSQREMSAVLSFFSFMMIIGNLASVKIKNKFYSMDSKGFRRNLHAFVVLTLLFTLLYVRANFWLYVILIVPHVLCKSILETTWTEMLISRAGETERGKIMGAFDSIMHMAGLAMPILAGYIGETYGYTSTFSLSVAPCFVASVIANLCLVNSKSKRSKKD